MGNNKINEFLTSEIKGLSPAKINLFLEICDKYPDGYHSIKTIFQTIDLFDEIKISVSENNTNNTNNTKLNILNNELHMLPVKHENLIYKITSLFFNEEPFCSLNKRFDININLNKKIPIASGLAGGSSNAAITLLMLNKIFNNIFSENKLLELAQNIGSDVPFCLKGGRMIGTGRGDQLIKLPYTEELIVLLILPPPDIKLISKDVYKIYDNLPLVLNKSNLLFEKFITILSNENKLNNLSEYLYNDLEEASISLSFWVEEIKSKLQAKNINSIVSGSGPSVFTILNNMSFAENIREDLLNQGFNANIYQTIKQLPEIK
jgi:4-diphosphocytidyl-2-C-methyl-D-erythritol kinase